jgi:hypothetical protein
MDTPLALKEHYVPGEVWEVYCNPLLAGLDAMTSAQEVIRVALAGDHLRIIVSRGLDEKEIKNLLVQANLQVVYLQRGEPSLEDVFTSLAKG